MKRFITCSGKRDLNWWDFTQLLKKIKAVPRSGLLCQYQLAVTITSKFFWLAFNRGYQDIETNTENILKDARGALEATNLEEDKRIVSLDIKSLNNYVRVVEAIKTAPKELSSGDEVTETPRLAMKFFLIVAPTYFRFKFSKMWYTEWDN